MVIALLALALAAPVACDPTGASTLLIEARIDEADASRTHPWLVPGLALGSDDLEPGLKTALTALCASGGELTVATADHYETGTWAARSLRLTRTEIQACTLLERSILISIGHPQGRAPIYTLQAELPSALTPMGDCTEVARWVDDQVLAGADGPVQIVLEALREGGQVHHSSIKVRRATPEGWHEQVLIEPAPDRLLGGFDGPLVRLAGSGDDWVVVASANREGSPESCTAIPGQQLWQWHDSTWRATDGRDALGELTRRGLWRLAGEPAWMLMLAVRTSEEQDNAQARVERLQLRRPEHTLLVLDSGDFPLLNPGYWIVTPRPWGSFTLASDERRRWGRVAQAYIKQAWPAPDACPQDPG